jgi:hypothetical protein
VREKKASFNFEREEREWLSSDGKREKGREGEWERLGSFKMATEEREIRSLIIILVFFLNEPDREIIYIFLHLKNLAT